MCQVAVATTSDHISVHEEVTEVNSFRHMYRRYLVITRRESLTLFLATLFKKKQLLLLRTNRGSPRSKNTEYSRSKSGKQLVIRTSRTDNSLGFPPELILKIEQKSLVDNLVSSIKQLCVEIDSVPHRLIIEVIVLQFTRANDSALCNYNEDNNKHCN